MKIVNFGQVVDLEGGNGLVHQFLIKTDIGEIYPVVTTEGTIAQLLAIVSGNRVDHSELDGLESDPAQYHHVEQPEEVYAPTEFGGEEDPGEIVSEPVMGVISDVPSAVAPQNGGLGQPRPKGKPKHVQKDAWGYPIVDSQPAQSVPADDDGTQM